jgi:hypothetical protein
MDDLEALSPSETTRRQRSPGIAYQDMHGSPGTFSVANFSHAGPEEMQVIFYPRLS